MKQHSHEKIQRVAAVAFISTLFCVTASSFPLTVAADVVRVETNPLIPQSRTCLPLAAHGFTPYIYDGELHSFEFTVPDRSYVALTGSVGGTFVPFQFMTRHGNTGELRVHVDIESISARDLLPISVTLISAKGGNEPVCMSTVIMTASVAEGKHSPISLPSPSKEASVNTAPSSHTGIPGSPVRREGTTTPRELVSSPTAPEPSISMLAAVQNSIVGSCTMEGGETRLWVVLLAVFVVVTGMAVLSQVPSTYSKGQRVTSIVVPLVFLLVFWYLFEACRAPLWAPLAALAIATLGILSLYWDDPRISGVTDGRGKSSGGNTTSPKPNSSTPLITPPPTKKP